MLSKPKYTYKDSVKFKFGSDIKEGIIYIIDSYGTFEDDSDVSYDIMVMEDGSRCLYKHINEQLIVE